MCARAREILGRDGFTAPPQWVDWDLPFGRMTPPLMRELERLAPFGERNERPVLFSSDLRLAQPARTVGSDQSHLQLQLRHGAQVLKAMAFGMAARAGELKMGAPVHAIYSPRWNTFRGETSLEIELVDFATGPRPEL